MEGDTGGVKTEIQREDYKENEERENRKAYFRGMINLN